MNNKLEALITDLDGSLLTDAKTIGQQDIATLQALQAKGVHVFVATGRHQCLTRVYYPQLGLNTPVVTSNGGLLYDYAKEEILSMTTISREDAATLADFSRQHGLIYYLYTDHQCILNPANPNSASYQFDKSLFNIAQPGECMEMGPDFNLLDHTILKFMIPDCPAAAVEALAATPLGQSGRITWAYSGEDFLDINAGGVSKGSAVSELAQRYGFSLEHTLAMGDNFNDYEMLCRVGYPVVPETAREDLKPYARHITCSNNHNPITHIVHQLFPELLD